MIKEDRLQKELHQLKIEHRDLDVMINEINVQSPHNQLEHQRLKKRKLWLKDRIIRIESDLLPDIIA
ncbi:MAG: DUF465 domain-containing protein [Pseudomonadota bacterium]|nr:DUF465 domain-containing protein [Pseudomonadota bacterium]